MKIRIDQITKDALRKAVNESSQSDISKITGVAQNSISDYISGKTESWTEHTRYRLYPVYEKYLPEEYKIKQKNIRSNINQSLFGNVNSGMIDSDLISKKALIKRITALEISAEIKLQIISIINDQ